MKRPDPIPELSTGTADVPINIESNRENLGISTEINALEVEQTSHDKRPEVLPTKPQTGLLCCQLLFGLYIVFQITQEQQLTSPETSKPSAAAQAQETSANVTGPSDLEAKRELDTPKENPSAIAASDVSFPSSSEVLPLEERLKILLEPEDTQESIEIAKSFVNNLGAVNFDDPNMIMKVREYAVFLHKHVTGEELATVNAQLAKMDTLPPLRQSALQMEAVIHRQTAQHAALEVKTSEFKEKL